jgi:hypothetical protein
LIRVPQADRWIQERHPHLRHQDLELHNSIGLGNNGDV